MAWTMAFADLYVKIGIPRVNVGEGPLVLDTMKDRGPIA